MRRIVRISLMFLVGESISSTCKKKPFSQFIIPPTYLTRKKVCFALKYKVVTAGSISNFKGLREVGVIPGVSFQSPNLV